MDPPRDASRTSRLRVAFRVEMLVWVVTLGVLTLLLLSFVVPKWRVFTHTPCTMHNTMRATQPAVRMAFPAHRALLTASSSGSSVSSASGVDLRSLQRRDHPLRQRTIFVSVPAYRDPETPHTLVSLLRNAAFPARITIGVCEQAASEDEPVEAAALRLLREQAPQHEDTLRRALRMMRIPASAARGPILARWLIEQELYRDEDFLLMVDSHSQFAPAWDSYLLEEHAAAPLQPAVLTTYCNPYERANRAAARFYTPAMRLNFRRFEPDSRIPLWDADTLPPQQLRALRHPPFTFGWSGNCAFMPRAVVRAVPFHDGPTYPFLFFGEEVGMAVRLFTHGVHLFAPRYDAILCLYERDYRPLYWNEVPDRKGQEEASRGRMRRMLGMEAPGQPHGLYGRQALGSVRTLEQYKQYSGMDLAAQRVEEYARTGEPRTAVLGWS